MKLTYGMIYLINQTLIFYPSYELAKGRSNHLNIKYEALRMMVVEMVVVVVVVVVVMTVVVVVVVVRMMTVMMV